MSWIPPECFCYFLYAPPRCRLRTQRGSGRAGALRPQGVGIASLRMKFEVGRDTLTSSRSSKLNLLVSEPTNFKFSCLGLQSSSDSAVPSMHACTRVVPLRRNEFSTSLSSVRWSCTLMDSQDELQLETTCILLEDPLTVDSWISLFPAEENFENMTYVPFRSLSHGAQFQSP